MKKIVLITLSLLSLSLNAQTKKQKGECFSFISRPGDWKVVIAEKFYSDTGIKHRKYVSNDNELVTVNYVRDTYSEGYSFSDNSNDNIIKYKDPHMNIVSAYSHYTPCTYTYGDNDEYAIYIRGYVLINNAGEETLMVVESETDDFRNIIQVLIKTEKGLVVSEIY